FWTPTEWAAASRIGRTQRAGVGGEVEREEEKEGWGEEERWWECGTVGGGGRVGKMSEERPVPRRESPWGLPEGDTRQPKAHRCNDRAEDVVQAVFEGNPFKTVPGPFKLFYQCMRSKPGEEPTEPYTYLQLDPPRRVEVNLEQAAPES
ncbi:unnamed protein product, partial [Urochloa humidicola]